jgi:hypothetical protein
MTKFNVGSYKTEGGYDAEVKFILREPNNSYFPLIGQIKTKNDGWMSASWARDGSYGTDYIMFNLVPPPEVTYRRVPCAEHVSILGSGFPERSYDGAAPQNCPNCRVERIERVNGEVTKVELVEARMSDLVERLRNHCGTAWKNEKEAADEIERLQQLAKSVASFLYWSSWLNEHDKGNVWGVSPHTIDNTPSQSMGTRTFERLKGALDRACPGWRSWNSNYEKEVADE